MAAIKLITTADFTVDTVKLPDSLLNAANSYKVDRAILEAQQMYLKPLLGYALYNDMLHKSVGGSTVPDYVKLLTGETYTDPLGYSVDYLGIKIALVYWTIARITLRNQSTITSHSVVTKTSQYSEPISLKQIAFEVDANVSMAGSYWQDAKKYLNDNYTKFPNWGTTKKIESSGPVRISSISPLKKDNNCNDYNR